MALFALRMDLYEAWPSGYVTLLFAPRRTVLLWGISPQKDTAKATQPSVGSSQERWWQLYLDWWGCGRTTGLPCMSSALGQAREGIWGCLGLREEELMVQEEGHLHPPQTPMNRSVGGKSRSSARSLPLARGGESCPQPVLHHAWPTSFFLRCTMIFPWPTSTQAVPHKRGACSTKSLLHWALHLSRKLDKKKLHRELWSNSDGVHRVFLSPLRELKISKNKI